MKNIVVTDDFKKIGESDCLFIDNIMDSIYYWWIEDNYLTLSYFFLRKCIKNIDNVMEVVYINNVYEFGFGVSKP